LHHLQSASDKQSLSSKYNGIGGTGFISDEGFCDFNREQCLNLRRLEKELYLIHKGLDDDEDNEM
jgi:hypothetical protein